MHHAARAEKQQGLEKSVSHQVKDSGSEGAYATRQKHVSQLADGGIGERSLDIGLHQRDGGGEKCGGAANRGDGKHGQRRLDEEHVRARHHVHARGHHGGGMDQRADGRGAFHGVGQPDVKRELCRFSGGPGEQEQGNCCKHSVASRFHGHGGGIAEDGREIERAKLAEEQKQSQQETEIADAVYPKRLIARIRSGFPQEPESNQQIAAQAHAFPSHEEHQVVRRQHQHQHEKHEQVEIGEKSAIAGVVLHVADGIEMDEPADAGHHEQHDQRELIDLQSEIRAQAPSLDPGEVRPQPGNLIGAEAGELATHFEARQKREAGTPQSHGIDGAARPTRAKNAVGGRAQQGQQWNDPEVLEYQHSGSTASAD